MAICEPSCGSRTAGRSKVACSTAPWAWAWPRNAASAETRRATSRIVDVTVSSLRGDTKRSFPGSNAHASPCVPRPARLRPCAARLGRYPKLRASASCRLRGHSPASAYHPRIPPPRRGRGQGEGEWWMRSNYPSPRLPVRGERLGSNCGPRRGRGQGEGEWWMRSNYPSPRLPARGERLGSKCGPRRGRGQGEGEWWMRSNYPSPRLSARGERLGSKYGPRRGRGQGQGES